MYRNESSVVSRRPNDEIVIFDTEFTTWEGALARRWMGPNEHREIIEIGAIRVSWPDGTILDEIRILVRPKLNPKLSPYCIKLTGISQDLLDIQGVQFQQALAMFCQFCGERISVSFGNDVGIISENIVINRCDSFTMYGKRSPGFVNIRPWITSSNWRTAGLDSGELWTVMGGSLPKKFDRSHASLSDCYSLLASLLYMRGQGEPLPF
ncbi:3'-5' exonuclease [Rhizobium paknamense]|uniref:Inhibitor of KinA sporulation pathway (Predicted exonuclease) n=1 Tax=Rhizobium paknamense TaxID=1206817 RepID=A0ABU0IJE3_9HYPH|nr:3'-5' exonuclease [Rhizobium paknamense]MDQ0458339.1 inhibitor of KinA sporulation pathway (predicted exonuclease) [Rhizobium paknamense]